MSIKGRVFGSVVVGAAGLAAAGAVGIARQNRVIARHARTVIRNFQQTPPARFDFD